jgi:sugar (pentulose or hexulose) kinase
MPRDSLFLGIDIGTSGCRAIVIDDSASVVAESRAPLPPSRRDAQGNSDQRPGDWWQTVAAMVAQIDPKVRARVRSVAVDGTSSTLLLCTTDGRPLTPALMYNDTRSGTPAQQIARVAPADSPARGAGSALAKLMYLYNDSVAAEAAHALHQADWIAGRMTGVWGVSDENNCLKLGYDPTSRSWPDWISQLDVPLSLLPVVKPVGTPIANITADAAAQLGLPDSTLIVAGTTDSNAATLAAGATDNGDAVTSLGSTLVVKIFSDTPVASGKYGVYSHRIGERWLVGGASNSGGAVLRQFFDDETLEALSQQINPDVISALDYYPLPGPGERFPTCDATLPPRLTPRPDDKVAFLHGLLEGIAAIEAQGYARLANLGAPKPRRVLSSGGGAFNDVWRRIRQRHLGVPVELATHVEAAYGSALLARAARN